MLSSFPRLRLFLTLQLIFFATFALLRVGFYQYFLANMPILSHEYWQALSIGLRFDLRIAFFMTLPIGLISLLPGPIGLKGAFGKTLALILSVIGIIFMLCIYIFDFGHYAYLGVRLNASVLEFAEDGFDSVQMVWESYPVIWLLILLVATTVISWKGISLLITNFRKRLTKPALWWQFALLIPVFIGITFFSLIGKVNSVVPLRWSDAFASNNPAAISLAQNPLIFFISTYQNQSRPYDKALLKATYPLVAEFLAVDNPDVDTFNFSRQAPAYPRADGKTPNVVFIHLESLGANRSGLYGNKLDATPYMDKIAQEGYFFPNFLVPASGTARTIFGLITGIPDVTWGGSTGTRNPLISKQYTLVNAFENYKKLYFIGGDAGWANVQGLLQHSIPELELHQERDFDAPAVDVWGISDHSLLNAANKRLNEVAQEQPFVAFIQLAGNHRPFTIPNEDIGFEKRDIPLDEIYSYGFNNLEHYNAVRLQDYNLKVYLDQLVPQSHYANNTIFLMYGDHNTRSVLPTLMDMYSEPLGLNNHHVPFIIYAPGLIDEPKVIQSPASLVDLLPTALGMAGIAYENRTMGRDLFHWQGTSVAMSFGGDRSNQPSIGLLSDNYYLNMVYNGKNARLFKLDAPKDNIIEQEAELAKQQIQLLHGLYQTATYMQTHNVVNDKE